MERERAHRAGMGTGALTWRALTSLHGNEVAAYLLT